MAWPWPGPAMRSALSSSTCPSVTPRISRPLRPDRPARGTAAICLSSPALAIGGLCCAEIARCASVLFEAGYLEPGMPNVWPPPKGVRPCRSHRAGHPHLFRAGKCRGGRAVNIAGTTPPGRAGPTHYV
jgi:hypothetical protein